MIQPERHRPEHAVRTIERLMAEMAMLRAGNELLRHKNAQLLKSLEASQAELAVQRWQRAPSN